MITRLLPVLLVCLATAPPVPAASFVINNLDGPGEGFNDPTPVAPVGGNNGTTLGQQRLNLFQKAAEIWGAAIESTVPIIVQARFDPLSCNAGSAVLGAAGTINIVRDFTGAPESNTWYHSALANAIAGVDLIPGSDDIRATFNSAIDNNNNCLSGTNWYLGYDHNHGNDIDLLVVLLHEFAHGLGFSGFTNLSTGRFLGGFQDIYSHFTLDNSNGLHWNEMSNGQRRASATNTGNVVWDGSAVDVAAAGFLTGGTDPAGHARLYAPSPVQSGSSISHFDTAASPNLLMEPFITPSLGSDLDLTDEQLFDVGWIPADVDADGDGVPDSADLCPATAAGDPVDADGCSDFQKDTDGDGLSDGLENQIGTDPLVDADYDSDGLTDYQEVNWDGDATEYDPVNDLNPLADDTDGDGFKDGMEDAAGYDPLLDTSFPVWGDIDDDRDVDAADVLLATGAVLGHITLDSGQLARGNVAPLVGGTPQPPLIDEFNTADVLLILRKALDATLY
ncbi:MAG: thrombospondin type 3 repeat-containing protein [Gammaproteobacteria bacterium]|nr:thrombospondin type 3 repeat-containing protein [Gammaproteobacteria bacterium]